MGCEKAVLVREMRVLTLKHLSPHDALKHHFTSLKTDLILLKLGGFRRKISMKLLPIHSNFPTFFIHFKSSLFTTSRELRQQFAACSG